MANVLPPPPINDPTNSFIWMEWYRQLRAYISQSGSVPWNVLDFSGSNISDIAIRNHNNLQTLQGGSTGQYYHLTQEQFNAVMNYLDVQTTTSGITLPTTPTVIKPATNVASNGILYNSSTGIYTFTNGGNYNLSFTMNATPSGTNKNVYFYAEENTGSGWVIKRYSARSRLLTVTARDQTLFTAAVHFAAGTQTRHYVWADATVTLDSTDLPGTAAGTVTVPAIRVSWTGAL